MRESDLKGYKIPGSEEKLIANLFADDTTTFLLEDDDFETLQKILDTWCEASTAKFNIQKTEIIPIGTPEYRQRVINTRKAKAEQNPIPGDMHIAKDGEAVRILGAWIGNKVQAEGVWAPMLEKIDEKLEQWSCNKPTMEGRRLITQMIIGGMTQYLAQVQGMPKEVETRMTRRIRKFMWDKKSLTPVNEQTLLAPIAVGGRSVLDIVSRNEAINVMWLKKYLNFGPNRPMWALVADAMIAKNVPQTESNVDPIMRQNVFLQSWKTKMKSKVPKAIQNLLNTAKKFNVRPEGISLSKEIKQAMPIWYNQEVNPMVRQMTQTQVSRCLRQNHQI
jgi:hypothetical protein